MTAVEPVEPRSTRLQGWMQADRGREGEERDVEGENKDLNLSEGKEETKEWTGRWVKIGFMHAIW